MLKIPSARSIPERLELSIKDMYTNTKAKVLSPDGEAAMFDIISGVLQGDTLAPFLFIIVLDYTMRQSIDGREEELGVTFKNRSRRGKPELITNLDFVDDIALLSDQTKQAHELLNRVEKELKKIAVDFNTKKTKFMAYNLEEELELKLFDGTKLKELNDIPRFMGRFH